ncbi:hypothetical protein KKG38_02135 [Patescibacteria group bacterium]|nr:hypothetical protein [Patescibacteria group bacterium]MBU1901463.1 hypothetical protein [Patescibacteria group bacterium]
MVVISLPLHTRYNMVVTAIHPLVRPYQEDIYRTGLEGFYGAELELVLFRRGLKGNLIPVLEVARFLGAIWKRYPKLRNSFDKEFYGGQFEIKSGPYKNHMDLIDNLLYKVFIAQEVAEQFGWEVHAVEFLHGKIPQGVSPLNERYEEYRKQYPHKADSMYRVASLHIHRGASSLEQAIDLYNAMVRSLPIIVDKGWIDPTRLKHFNEIIFPVGYFPPEYNNLDSMVEHARSHGFLDSLRGNYSAVRIHEIYGTAELRVMGPTLERSELIKRFRFVDMVCRPYYLMAA